MKSPTNMRRILSSFFLAFASLSAFAAPVSPEQAFRIAQEFYQHRSQPLVRASVNVPQSTPVYVCYRKTAKSVRSTGNNQACFYVFNTASERGFVMVAGDDRAREVLAYSDSGAFEPDNIPASCAAWLQTYEEEMTALLEYPDAEADYVSGPVDYPVGAVLPLVQTKWGQGDPYNLFCPIDEKAGTGVRTVVGCTATAVAQIMYYHQYPEHPSGSVRYTDSEQGVERYMDFDAEAPFNWQQMLLSYAGADATEEQCEAVAHLMVCVGHAAQMAYSSGTSISGHKTACEGLFKYFGYDTHMRRYERNYMTAQEWVDVLVEELQAGRPVCYDGRNPSGGHTFVCDGYDGNGMFHFNWGWEGLSDGYYALSALQPGQQGIGGTGVTYTLQQVMECGIQPPSTETPKPDNQVVVSSLYTMELDGDYSFINNGTLTTDRSAQVGLFAYCRNIGRELFQGNLCWAYETTEGIRIVGSPVSFIAPEDSGNQPFRWWLDADGLAEGEYTISIYGCADGSDKWEKLSAGATGCNTYVLTLAGTTVTFRPQMPVAGATVAADFIPETLYTNTTKDMVLPLLNSGTMRLECPVGLLLRKTDTPSFYRYVFFRVLCEPGEQLDVAFTLNFNNCLAGDYQITPFYCPSAGWYGGVTLDNMVPMCDPIPVTLTAQPWIGVGTMTGSYVLDLQEGALPVVLMMPVADSDWMGRVVARVFRDGEDTGVCLSTERITLQPKTPVQVSLTLDDACTLIPGDGYTVQFELADGYETVLATAPLTVNDSGTGVDALLDGGHALRWEVTGNVLSVSAGALRAVSLLTTSGTVVATTRMTDGASGTVLSLYVPQPGIYLLKVETAYGIEVKKIMIP